jgi:hypothetical protein
VLAHGKDFFAMRRHKKRTAMPNAWQRGRTVHGKEKTHGKDEGKCTAMQTRMAKRK